MGITSFLFCLGHCTIVSANELCTCIRIYVLFHCAVLSDGEVKTYMHRSGTETIRTQIQPSNPKREITNLLKAKSNTLHCLYIYSFSGYL